MNLNFLKSKYNIFIDEKFLAIDLRSKIVAIVSIFFVTFFTMYIFFIKKNIEDINSINEKIVSSSRELEKAKKIACNLQEKQQEFNDILQKFELTSILLPKTQEIPDLLRDISDLGKHSGLDFLSFIPKSEMPKDFYAEIPIDIKIRGPYHNLGIFLDKVSKLERIVTVNNIKTEHISREGDEMLLTSSCRLITYRFTNKTVNPDLTK